MAIITENLEQINASFPCLASMDNLSIYILSNVWYPEVSSFAAIAVFTLGVRY